MVRLLLLLLVLRELAELLVMNFSSSTSRFSSFTQVSPEPLLGLWEPLPPTVTQVYRRVDTVKPALSQLPAGNTLYPLSTSRR